MDLELAVMVFRHMDDADRVYADASVEHRDATWLREAAVVEHHRHDRVEVRGTVGGQYMDAGDEGDVVGKRTLEGALTGAAVGCLFGPAGMAAGFAAGGTIGGVHQAESGPHVHNAFFDEVRGDVPEKSSAIVLLAATSHVDEMVAVLEGKRNGKLIRRELTDEVASSLQEAALAS
jgi:uncharacterized membrane protein